MARHNYSTLNTPISETAQDRDIVTLKN